jgi:cytochrome c oxidase assembly protein subunit 15
MIRLHRFARFVAFSTVLLIAAGAMVTSTGSGLAVPDWPSTYGQFMFTFPLSKMVGGIFYEHGHRLIASGVGLLTIVLAAWTWRVEPRRWVRRLAVLALGAVVLQGLLGGLTVLFFLPAPVSIGHAGLAQMFFCLTVSLALVTSPGWIGSRAPVDDARLRRLAVGVTALAYGQILLGATMRHIGAGLAIPDFPLAFGRALPPEWSAPIAIHFAHRVGALVVAVGAGLLVRDVLTRHRARRELVRPAVLLAGLLAVQMTLGALVVLTGKAVAVNSAHVIGGALVLATSLVITLRAYRARFGRATEPVPQAGAVPAEAALYGRAEAPRGRPDVPPPAFDVP